MVAWIYQEIIKVREGIPHIGPLTKVIRLKLFIDIVPSSYDFLELPEKNGGNVILYVLVSFHTGDVFCTLSRLFCAVGDFVCFSARLAVHYFAVYSVLGS